MQNQPNCFYRVSAKALIYNENNEFLMVLEDNGNWEMPGGGIDHGETPQDCIKREVFEEMGVKVTHVESNPSFFISAVNKNGVHVVNILFKTQIEGLQNFKPTPEALEAKFFTVEEAKNLPLFENGKKIVGLLAVDIY